MRIGAIVKPVDDYRADLRLMRMMYVWIVLLLFQYKYMRPMLEIRLGLTMNPARIMCILCLIAYFTSIGKPSREKLPGRALGLLTLIFGVVCIFSWSAGGADAGEEKFRWLTTIFNISLEPTLAFFMGRKLRYNRAMLTELLTVFTGVGLYLGFTAVAEHKDWISLVRPYYINYAGLGVQYGRSRGPLLSSAHNGGILLMCFLSLSLLSTLIPPEDTRKKKLSWFLLLLAVAAIYFTDQRSAWLGFAASIITLLVTRTPMRKTTKVLVTLGAVVLLSGAASKFSLTGNTLFSRRQNTVDYRMINFQTLLRMFDENPMFGVGYGKFKDEWSNYFSTEDEMLTRDLNDGNHSTPLGILAETGLVGFVPFMAMFPAAYWLCFSAYRNLRAERWDFERGFVIVALGSLEAYTLASPVQDLRFEEMRNVALFFILGIVCSIHWAAKHAMAGESVTRPVVASPLLMHRRGANVTT